MSATGEMGAGQGVTPTPGPGGGVTPPETASGEGVTPSPTTPQTPPGERDASGGSQHGAGERRDADPGNDVAELRATLKREREHTKAFERELRELQRKEKERAEAEMSELEKAQARAESAEARVAEMEREALARTIAAESGIPTLWHRLSGNDARTLRADAARMREELGMSQGALDGGVRGGVSQSATPTMDDLIRGGAGR